MKVSLFITCLTDAFYPRSGIAAVKVLEHLGCEVDFPWGQTCCGQPMFNNGFEGEARELAKRMVGVFEGSERVVTPSASCAAMVREHFPELLRGEAAWERAAEDLARKTFEFSEFLVKVLKVDLRSLGVKWEGRVTSHYSCHLRGLGVKQGEGDHAAGLLGQIPGLECVPLEKADQCCGFGGMFAVKYPQISGAMAADKVECIRGSGAETVVSNEAGCTMNMSGACHRAGVEARFISLAEVIAEGLGLLEEFKVQSPRSKV